MTRTTKIKIKESGIKVSFLAKKIGVTPNYLYMCMSGERHLSNEKEQLINLYIK